MELADKTLKCAECAQDFIFSVDEQKFYQEKGFKNEPKRCLPCRKSKRMQRRGARGVQYTRTEVVCATCGKTTEVPFKPVQNRPVYCNECFAKSKDEAGNKATDEAPESVEQNEGNVAE